MFHPHYFAHARHARLFERGDLKYVILDLLQERPSHGYEIIRALEERSHGLYSPSAGSVYPTLQLLEDMGYISVTEQEGKKVYTITEAGRGFLAERKDSVDKIKAHLRDFWTPDQRAELRDIVAELRGLGDSFHRRVPRLGHEKLVRIKDIVVKTRRDIESIINE